MKKILYINGSPRGEKGSNSAQILKDLAGFLKEEGIQQEEFSILTLARKIPENPDKQLEELDSCDIWILGLPLYVDSLPGHICRWLSLFQTFRASKESPRNIRVYGIINCGFPEAIQNSDALSILELFCRKAELEWRMGIGIGMGEAYIQMKGMPLRSPGKAEILKAFQELYDDLNSDAPSKGSNLFARVKFPRWLYRLTGSLGWIWTARKNGLKLRDLYARPLLN